MIKTVKKIILLSLLIFIFDCHDESINPISEESLEISDVINLVWKLESYEIENKKMDLSIYKPFHLVYDHGEFWGYDGCNQFGGLYKIENDSIFPTDFYITERACDGKSFSMLHLWEPYGVFGIGNNNTIFFYGKGGGGSGIQPLRFANKVLRSTFYHVEKNDLT